MLTQVDAAELQAVGITNQRETILLWDRETLGSPRRAIVWQDRRTADICDRLRDEGHEDRVAELTGLRLDPYFSGTKLMWLAEHEPHTWALVESGRYAVGTVDSYLIARMTRGTWHVTDVVQRLAARCCSTSTTGEWSDELCSLFGVPRDALPDLVPNWGEVAHHRPVVVPRPVAADRRASPATSSRRCSGRPASTSATPSAPTAPARSSSPTPARRSSARTPACCRRPPGARPDGELTYALEGAIFVTGAAVQWLRDGLQIVGSAAETAAIAATVDDTDGVVFVPALTGLGAPHWDPHARGTDHRHHPRHHPRAHRPRHARGDRLRGPRRARDDARTTATHPARRRRRVGQRPALPAPGRPGRRRGASGPKLVETTGARCGVPRRARHRRLVVDRRPARDLAARPGLRPRPPTATRADAAHARWIDAVERSKGWAAG